MARNAPRPPNMRQSAAKLPGPIDRAKAVERQSLPSPGRSTPRARRLRASGLEIDRLVNVGDQPGLCCLPSQFLPGQRARGLVVDRGEMREPAEMLSRFLRALADHRQTEPAA